MGSSFSDLFILYDFVPEDVRFLLSGQPEVLGALGDPRMVVDNDGGGFETRCLTSTLVGCDVYAVFNLVSVALAAVPHEALAINWSFHEAARAYFCRDL